VHFIDSGNGWASGQIGTILHTSDGGESWEDQSVTSFQELTAVFFANATDGWVSGTGGTLMRSSDGGQTWSPQTSGVTTTLNQLFFTDSSTGWAVGARGVILHTADGGLNWAPQVSNATSSLNNLHFTDANNGWVVGSGGTVLRTSDGGATWERRDVIPSTASSSGVSFLDANTGWIIMSEQYSTAAILGTTDGGSTWTRTNLGINIAFQALQFTSPQDGWGVSAGGAIIKFSENVTSVAEATAAVPDGFDLFRNYPNPFNPSTTITYALAHAADIELTIFNALGQHVRTLASGYQSTGAHSLSWDGRDDHGRQLGSGIYYYRLAAGEMVQCRRMLLLR
jgi:photosystem II stability/assembly factor-like uncharacterized protein